jgi:hypothetical protein
MSLFVGIIDVYATDIENLISSMNGTSDMATDGNGIRNTINNVIGLIQFAGTGISVIVVTMLGIKYILASPSEKADVKKQIAPILIGCVLLFGAVNLVAIIADFTLVLNA